MLKIKDDVWVFGGPAAIPIEGVITEILFHGARMWGYRVKTSSRHEPDHGSAYAPDAVYLRPDHRERLLIAVTNYCDILSAAAEALSLEAQDNYATKKGTK